MKQVKLTIEMVYDIQQDMSDEAIEIETKQLKSVFIGVPYASYFNPVNVSKKTEIVESQ